MERSKDSLTVLVRPQFEGHETAVVEYDGRPLWSARQIGEALGYKPGALPRQIGREWSDRFGPDHVVRFEGEDLAELKAMSPDLVDARAPSLLMLTERGVYRVLMLSGQPKALAFQDWLDGTVLPTIRRTGGFGASSGPSLEERVGRFALETAWYDPNRVSIVARVMRAMKQGATGVSGIALLAKMKQGNVRFALMEAERHGLVRQTQRGYELSVGEPSAPLVIDELARNLLGGGR